MASREDVPAIVALFADDPLGAQREHVSDPLSDAYWRAFEAIDDDPNNGLVVAEASSAVVGCLQLTYIQHLNRQGSWRAQIEGVRVGKAARGQGVGRRIMEWAIERAHDRGCALLQLSTDKTRPEAHRFYESLGFTASHEGMKLGL